MASYDYDVIVLGSGAGGNIAAQQLAKASKRVAVVEHGTFGGNTPTHETIPMKALLHAAHVYESARHGSRFGVRGSTVGYNYPSVKAWKDLVVKRTGIANGEQNFMNSGINVVHGRGYFIDPHTITVGSTRFSAKEFLIATGSELTLPDIPGLSKAGFLTLPQAVNLTRPPKSLAIIGAGDTGCELAVLFATFGTKVYLIDTGPRILSQHEPEVSSLIQDRLSKTYSVSLFLDSSVEKVEKLGINRRLTVASGTSQQVLNVDEIIVATTRSAATDIGLENAGVKHQNGAIFTGSYLQTSADHIYAAGSCTGIYPSTHVAAYQSQIAAHNLLHAKRPIAADYRAVPRVLFTNPEVAVVGPTEQELRERKISFKSATAPLSVIARANAADYSDGFVKVIASSKTGVLLGASIVSPHAGEMIQELTVAVQNYLTAEQVAKTIHPFPTWSEAVRVACSNLARS